MIRLAVIGLGVRASSMVSCLIAADPEVRLVAAADPSPEHAKKSLATFNVPSDDVRFYDSAESLLKHADDFDGLLIGTRCDLHTPLAVLAADTGLPLFLEKPVAIDEAQLQKLASAFAGREDNVVVSFPLRVTPLIQRVMDIVRSGRLGTINEIQAVNYVPYGGVYFGQWYRDFQTTGGLWLQKATHDLDYIAQLAGAEPTTVAAMHTRQIFGGDQPPELRCSQCSLTDECTESPKNIALRNDDGGMGREDHLCAFSSSIRHHDAGSALLMFTNGIHANYTQNFVARKSAASRGARITGYKATLQFDWFTESYKITHHHDDTVEEQKVTVPNGHHGGDTTLARNFVAVMRGQEISSSTLADGLRSAAMCIAAEKSMQTGGFVHISDILKRKPAERPQPVSAK